MKYLKKSAQNSQLYVQAKEEVISIIFILKLSNLKTAVNVFELEIAKSYL